MTVEFDRVLLAVHDAASDLPELSTDDVWLYLEYPPAERNMIGKAFAEANRHGWIAGTERFIKSRRPEAKGRRVQVWTSKLRTDPRLF